MWSLDFIIGIVIATLLLAMLIVGYHLATTFYREECRKADNNERNDVGLAIVVRAVCFVAIIVTAGITLATLYPYKAEYHQIREKAGIVQAVDSRFLSPDGKGTEQKFVVTINGHAYGCEDTRCALVQPGDYLVLGCQRVWQYGSTDGYDCVFRRLVKR